MSLPASRVGSAIAKPFDKLAISFDAVNLTEEMQQAYYAFGSAGGPSTMNFGNLLLSRSYALGVRWRM